MIPLQLFLAFLQIGALGFGGGYAAMPLIEHQVIDRYGWLGPSDFADLVTISEMTPGPIGINAATFAGNLAAGIPGAVCATLGFVLPSCVFVTILAYLYYRYKNLRIMQGILKVLRPAVVAMILSAGLRILIPALFRDGEVSFAAGNFNVRAALYFTGAVVLLRKFRLGPVKVMLLCGAAEMAVQAALAAGL